VERGDEVGSLIKRQNGIYYAIFYAKDRQVWRSTHTRCLDEARKVFEGLDRQWSRQRSGTLSSFFCDFLDRAPLSYSPKTIQGYSLAFRSFERIIRNKRLKDVSPLDGEGFKRARSNEVSAVSVNIELRTLKAAFNEAKRLKLVEENPLNGVRPVRVADKEASHLSEPEFARLLSFIEDMDFKKLIKFALFTMMRLGEITSLRWDTVDLQRREILIRSSAEFRPKHGKARFVPMNDWVHAFLASKERTCEYVFSRNGKPLKGMSVSHAFKRYVRRAGLSDRIHFHSLRHSGISWLANNGVPQPFIQRIAGHSSLKVTEIYTHAEDISLFRAVNTFPSLN
jgi:integrase/recombinase XerD